MSWDVKNLLKLQLASVLGSAYFDAADFQRRLSTFCGEVAALGLSRVVLLSPLPCADRVFMRNRLQVVEHFRQEGKRFGFVYVDVMSNLLAAAQGRDIFHDSIHLNKKGHALLGQLVAQVLLDL